MNTVIRLAVVTLVTMFAGLSSVSAHTATRYFNVDVEDLAESGEAMDINGLLVLRNRFENENFGVQAQVSAPEIRGDKLGRDWVSDRYKIEAGGRVALPFHAELPSDGKHIVSVEILVFNETGFQIGHQHHNLYFQVKGGEYRVSTYEELYVPADARIDAPDNIRVSAPTARPSSTEQVVPLAPEGAFTFDERRLDYRQLPREQGSGIAQKDGRLQIDPNYRDRLRKEDLLKRQLPRDQIRPIQRDFPAIVPPTGDGGDKEEDGESKKGAALDQSQKHAGLGFGDVRRGAARFMTEAFGVSSAAAQTNYSISGKFSYRGLDSSLHPGWNWLAEVWWKKNDSDWVKLGAKYIKWDGSWSMDVSQSGFSGQNIHVFYRVGGYYLMPRNRDDNSYRWKDPVWTGISTNYNVGHRMVDLSASGTLAGLGDAYHSGLLYWWKFYSNNLNPERADPIKLYFPNTWFNCDDNNDSDNDPDPWSCASGDRVWLIPAHADEYTIQHELSHQLMSEYWDGDRPDGAGGAHNLYQCYNDGLALSEGFANAAPVWVLSGENAVDPQPGGFSIESPPSATCSGDTNELWVAGFFWDLLDRPSDGQDVLWFNNPAEVFAKVLRNGKKDGVKEFRTLYRNAASSGHEDLIDDIYDNNTIPVP